MPRARAKNSLHHIKMDNLAFLWELHIILIQILFLPTSLSHQSLITSQRSHSKLGQVLLAMLRTLECRSGRRNTLQVMHWIYQNHRKVPSKIRLKERKSQLRYLFSTFSQSQLRICPCCCLIFGCPPIVVQICTAAAYPLPEVKYNCFSGRDKK